MREGLGNSVCSTQRVVLFYKLDLGGLPRVTRPPSAYLTFFAKASAALRSALHNMVKDDRPSNAAFARANSVPTAINVWGITRYAPTVEDHAVI